MGRGGGRAGRPQRVRALARRVRTRRRCAREAWTGSRCAARSASRSRARSARGRTRTRRWGRLSRDAVLAPAIEHAGAGFPAWDGLIRAVEATDASLGGEAVDRRLPERLAAARAPVAARRGRPAAGPGRDAAHPRRRGLRRLLRRRPRRADRTRPRGGRRRPRGRRPARSPQHLGHADRHDVPRRPRHDPPAQQQRRARPRDPQRPGAVRAAAGRPVHRPRLDRRRVAAPAGSRPPSSPTRTATRCSPTRRSATSRWSACSRAEHAAALAARIDPRARRPRAGPGPDARGRHDLAGRRGRRRQRGEPHPVQRRGFGSGVVDPGTGVHFQNRGASFSLDPAHPNVLEPRKRTAHTLLPGMLFRDGRAAAVDRGRVHGRRHPAPGPRPARVGAGGRRGRHRDGRRGAAGHRGAGRLARAAGPRRRPTDRSPTGSRTGCGRWATGLGEAGYDGSLGHEHAIELVDGGPAAGGSLAAATDPRSAGLPAVR